MDAQSAAKTSSARDRQGDPNIPRGMLFPKNNARVHILGRLLCGKTDTSSERTAPGRRGLRCRHRHSHNVDPPGDGTDTQQSPTVDLQSERPNNAVHFRHVAPETPSEPRKNFAKTLKRNSSANESLRCEQHEDTPPTISPVCDQGVLISSRAENIAPASEVPEEPYDGATQLTSFVHSMPSALEDRRYTIQDSPEGSMVIMIDSSRVEDRNPLPSSKKNNLRKNDISPDPDQRTFACKMLDCRTQLPCDKVFTRRTTLKRHQEASIHSPQKRDFQCALCAKKYVFLSWLKGHMRDKHGLDEDPNAKENGKGKKGSGVTRHRDGRESDNPDGRSDLNTLSDHHLGSRASGNCNVNPEVQPGIVSGRHLRSRFRQPAGPSGDTSRHSSCGSTTTVSSFHYTDGSESSDHYTHDSESSDHYTDDSLPSRKQPEDASRTVLVCKLRKAKTGKVCNKIVSRTNAKWARSALKTHQKSSVHDRKKRKSFKCNQCDRKYSFPQDLKKHERNAHGVGLGRAPEFSDEESESSVDEQ